MGWSSDFNKQFLRKRGEFVRPFFIWSCLTLTGCSILATRPVQEMSDTAAAIRAAKEVQADLLAPEVFRQSNEWFTRAKKEYRLKNFSLAQDYSRKARFLAEQAEFEALRSGASRSQGHVPDTFTNLPPPPPPPPPPEPPPAPPEPEPTNTGIYYESYEEQMKAKTQPQGASATPAPNR